MGRRGQIITIIGTALPHGHITIPRIMPTPISIQFSHAHIYMGLVATACNWVPMKCWICRLESWNCFYKTCDTLQGHMAEWPHWSHWSWTSLLYSHVQPERCTIIHPTWKIRQISFFNFRSIYSISCSLSCSWHYTSLWPVVEVLHIVTMFPGQVCFAQLCPWIVLLWEKSIRQKSASNTPHDYILGFEVSNHQENLNFIRLA